MRTASKKMNKKEEEALALLAKMAEKHGKSIDVDTISQEVTSRKYAQELRLTRLDSADGVLRSLHYPHASKMKECDQCRMPFSTNYCYVTLCSPECRRAAFKKRFLIDWEYTGKPTFGPYEPPTVVNGQDTEALYNWAVAYVADYERVKTLSESRKAQPEEHKFPLSEEAEDYARPVHMHQDSVVPTVHPPTEEHEALTTSSSQEPEEEEFDFGFE